MIVREAKLLNGSRSQYARLDEAIRTAQFIRNKAVRLWRDERDVNKSRIYRLCRVSQRIPFC
jgi:putative transposase